MILIKSPPPIQLLNFWCRYSLGEPFIKYVRLNKPNIWPPSFPLVYILKKNGITKQHMCTFDSTPLPPYQRKYLMDNPQAVAFPF